MILKHRLIQANPQATLQRHINDRNYLTFLTHLLYLYFMRHKQSKRQFLKEAGAWNTNARNIDSSLFAQSDFFDPRDKVQVKYEMLRLHYVDGVTVLSASRLFGYSRESFYAALEALSREGIVGLADRLRGPKAPRKLTAQVQQFLHREIQKDPTASGARLAERVEKKLGVSIHKRSIERFCKMSGKKNRPRRRRYR
ncbi:MAG TPA: helix-turn-helix domain containing protein [Hyphomicrobiaceae bacterium]|nr:helix-turn-helix domain containing protein [Hyphomicrobiaceae bacterium]